MQGGGGGVGTEGKGKGLAGRARPGSDHGVGDEQERPPALGPRPSRLGPAACATEGVWDQFVLRTQGLRRMEDDRALDVNLPHKR